MFLSFQWYFCLLLGNGCPGVPGVFSKVSFQTRPSNGITHAENRARSPGRAPCFGLLRGGRAFRHGFGGTTAWWHLCHFHNLYLERTDVARCTRTRRCSPSQQNAALDKASHFSSKPHILVRLANAARDTGPHIHAEAKALLSSALVSPPPPPAFPRTAGLHGRCREKRGGCPFRTLACSNKERNLEVFSSKRTEGGGFPINKVMFK